MKDIYPMQLIFLAFQVDHINPTKTQLHKNYRGYTIFARRFTMLISYREIEMISGGNKNNDVTVLWDRKHKNT